MMHPCWGPSGFSPSYRTPYTKTDFCYYLVEKYVTNFISPHPESCKLQGRPTTANEIACHFFFNASQAVWVYKLKFLQFVVLPLA